MYDIKYFLNDLISVAAFVMVIVAIYTGMPILAVPSALWIGVKMMKFVQDYENLQREVRDA